MSASTNTPLYLGFDLSTQQLKALVVDKDLNPHHEEAIVFDADLSHYGIKKGVLSNEKENEVYAPVAMWLEAVDLILARMKEKGFDFSRIKGISGAGQQHGSVYWSDAAESLLGNLDFNKSLVEQLNPAAFSHPWSPNWQDHSTQPQCDSFEKTVGGGEALARITGSKAHHRFTGPQILRFHQKHSAVYDKTARISLVSSFLCSVFLGRIAPFDISDVCGMNLWDIHAGDWSESLLATAAAGDSGGVAALRKKLGEVEHTPGKRLGAISKWFVERHGFDPECTITPFTGDNPSTILALPLRPLDVILSLGTSTTLLMATPTYQPSVEYHLFNHPTTSGLYMFMLCYTNGALARERIAEEVNADAATNSDDKWANFNELAESTPVTGSKSAGQPAKIGIYFPLPENIPNVKAGTWRFNYNTQTNELIETSAGWSIPRDDARAILESQALSMRLRSHPLLLPNATNGNKHQSRRVYVVGGASRNHSICEALGDVLGGYEGVYKLDIGGNACALGAAYYAAWALERKANEHFEDFVGDRWDEKGKIEKIGSGYKKGTWEQYEQLIEGFREAERRIIETAHN